MGISLADMAEIFTLDMFDRRNIKMLSGGLISCRVRTDESFSYRFRK